MSVVTVRRVKMVTVGMILSVFFLPGALAECPRDASISITTPKLMEALSGSCLLIPCEFSDISQQLKSSETTVGMWIKSTPYFHNKAENVIFSSSKQENIYPMRITGDLTQRNCTTLFSSLTTNYTDRYYFRIEDSPFKATASCDPVQITVSDSAPRPMINISGDGAVNGLKENQSVTITCSAVTPCPHSPPELTWTLQQDPRNIREQNADGTFTTKIQENITLSDTHDGLSISCSARYPVNEGRKKTAAGEIILNVSYAPKDTSVSISPPGLVSAGSWVNLTCSSRGNPPISSFTWFRNSKDGAIKVSEGWFYRINVTDGGDYYCMATNNLGNQTSSRNNIAESSESALKLGSALGAIVVVIICLAIYFWWFKSRRQTPQQPQSPNVEELTGEIPASEREEEIHYGEIDFSKRRPEPSSPSKQDGGQQQETLYGQVKVSKTADAEDVPEDLYAQVKKT